MLKFLLSFSSPSFCVYYKLNFGTFSRCAAQWTNKRKYFVVFFFTSVCHENFNGHQSFSQYKKIINTHFCSNNNWKIKLHWSIWKRETNAKKGLKKNEQKTKQNKTFEIFLWIWMCVSTSPYTTICKLWFFHCPFLNGISL